MVASLTSYRRLFISVLVISLGFLFFLTPRVSLAAFGASPPFVNATHLIPGAKYQQIVYLVRNNDEEELPIKVNLSLPETIKSWVTIEEGEEFLIPQGTRQFPVHVIIAVPQNTPLGVYSGSVTFGSQPKQSGQVAVSLGIEIPFNLTVGKDIYREMKVRLIKLLDVEEGWSPRVYVKVENNGNVPEKFDSATYELFDSYKDKRYAISQRREGFPEIAPFTTQEFTVDFPIDFHLGIGQYWGSVTFYQGDSVVGNQTTVFNVLKRGSLSNPAFQIFSFFRFETYWPFYGGGVVLFAFGALIYRKRRAKASQQIPTA